MIGLSMMNVRAIHKRVLADRFLMVVVDGITLSPLTQFDEMGYGVLTERKHYHQNMVKRVCHVVEFISKRVQVVLDTHYIIYIY
jgi:hypothetical protein